MQIDRVDTRVGTAISAEASRIAASRGLPFSSLCAMFSIATVASSTRMPTASARPPRVMMLMVWPKADSAVSEARIDSGMVMAMIRVARQLPRNSRIIIPVRQAAIRPSRITPDTAAVTKMDWSEAVWTCSDCGRPASIRGSSCFTWLMIARVEALPLFSISSKAERLPSVRTILVCGA